MAEILREGFESGKWTHDVRVFPVGSEPYDVQLGNVFTPTNWTFWFRHDPGTWDQPEARYCWKSGDPVRLHSGEGAYMWFSFHRCHDAGLMRRVIVEPGSHLHLTAWAHAWSNHRIDGHEGCYNDPRCSCGVGEDQAALSPTEVPPLSGDPWNDAIGNSLSVVGIDPAGGTDPFADTVMWGQPLYIYNGYAQLSASVEPGTSAIVTIFLRNSTLWPFKHNDIYWDDAVLEATDVLPPPPPGKCVPPRVQYARTYILLPQTVDTYEAMEWRTAAAIATADDLVTIGHSADDAGVGPLDRTVVAVNPASWTGEADDLRAFYDEYYAGVEYVHVDAGTPWEMAIGLLPGLGGEDIALAQTDPRWAGYDFGEHPGGGTFGGYGCFVTGLAIILRKAYQRAVIPPMLDKLLVASRAAFTDDNILVWDAATDLFPVFTDCIKNNKHYSAAELAGLLAQGWEIILRRADGKHFVYLESVEGDILHIIDTWDGKRKIKTAADHAGVRAARTSQPVPPPPPPSSGSLISLHLQTMVEGVLEFVAAVKPGVIKVFQMEDARAIKAASPETKVVLRYFTDKQDLGNPDKIAAARAYIATFRDSLETNAEWIDYVESWNETVCSNNPDSIRNAVAFDVAFADALAETGLPVAPALLTVAVGNPLESEVELLLPAVRKAIQYNGLVSYHAYWPDAPDKTYLESDWQWYAGRWTEWDKVFNMRGLYPSYYFGEMGAVGATSDLALLPTEGWRSSDCCGGKWDRYLAELIAFSEMVAEWNVSHSNRALGGTIFTTGGWGWDSFEIGRAEMEDLSRWLKD